MALAASRNGGPRPCLHAPFTHAAQYPEAACPMSLLAIQLPPRRRLGPHAPVADAGAALEVPQLWAHVFSADGRTAGPLRSAAPGELPTADEVVLVVAPSDVSWHRARLPRATAARMRQALLGTLEEQLLEDEVALHLALAAGATPGQQGWVAAAHAPHLRAALAALESAGVRVARITSALPPPGGLLRGHFSTQDSATAQPLASPAATRGAGFETTASGSDHTTFWTLSMAEGAWHLPLHSVTTAAGKSRGQSLIDGGGLAVALRNSLPGPSPDQRWTCTPAAATAARAFLGRPVPVVTAAEHVLETALSATNLRQFELQPQHRGLAALRAVRQLGRREWRMVRAGLWALLALQLLGFNAAAWSQQQALQVRRQAIVSLLQSSFPSGRTVLDAPAQMRAQVQLLRAAAGQPGPGDLESALAAAAAAWPEGKPPVTAIRFESARLTLASADWQAADVAALRQRLAANGWTVTFSDPLLALQHQHAPTRAEPK